MMKKLLLLNMVLCALFMCTQARAASFNGLQVTVTMDDGTQVQDIPSSGMPVIDLTDGGTETDATFIINGYVAQTTGNVQDVSLVGTVYKASRTPDGWRSIGGTMIRTNEWGVEGLDVDILEDLNVGDTYIFEFYVEGTDTSGNKFYYSNGGSNYKLKFTKGDSNAPKDVEFISGSMTIVRDGNDWLEYGFTPNGFYGGTNQLGELSTLTLDNFDVVITCADGISVNDMSIQYKVYPVGGNDGWGRINATRWFEDEGEWIYMGEKLDFDLLQNYSYGGDYVLQFMIQAIDNNGKYHFFGKDDNNDLKFYFSMGGSSAPQIVSLIINSTFNGETDDRYIDHNELNGDNVGEVSEFKINKISAWAIDDESLLESMWIDYHIYELGKDPQGWSQIYLTDQHTEDGEWSANTNMNLLQGLTPGKTYAFEFNLVGWDGNNHIFYRNDNRVFTIYFTVKGSSFEQGDVNGDGVVSGADVTALYNTLLDGVTPNGDGDVNGDGVISGADVTALYNILLDDKPVDKVYIMGDPAGGWATNQGLQMSYDSSRKVYTATINHEGDTYFGFTTKILDSADDWDGILPYRIGAVSDGDFTVTNENKGNISLAKYEDGGNTIFIPSGGEFTLTLDKANMTLSIEGDVTEVNAVNDYYIIGTVNNWSSTNLDYPFVQDPGDPNVHSITFTPKADEWFAIAPRAAYGSTNFWDQVMRPESNGSNSTYGQYITGGDNAWNFTNCSSITVTINTLKQTYSILAQ